MKKTIKTMLAFVAGAMALSACSNDELLEEQKIPSNGNMTFTATVSDEEGTATRASLDSLDIVWNQGDAISVFSSGNSVNSKMSISNGAGTTSGVFSGTCEAGSEYLAIYPYDANHVYELKNNENSHVTYTWNGATQTAVQGSFPKNTPMIAIAYDNIENPSSTVALQFKNVCSFIKVTTDYPCRSIELKSKNTSDKLVAKKLELTIGSDNLPEIVSSTETSYKVILTDENRTNLPAGTYYIAVLPCTLSQGFDLTFIPFTDNSTHVKSTTKSVTLTRSKVLNLGTVSLQSAETATLAGSGTDADPYQINTFADLKIFQRWITSEKGETWKKTYKQTADIDAQGETMAPIGTATHRFWGTYDGGGYTIKNLCIKGTVEYTVPTNTFTEKNRATALFGAIRGATIKNLTIENPSFASSNKGEKLTVSPFVGVAYCGNDSYTNSRCKIINCKLKGTCTISNEATDGSTYFTSHYGFIYGGFVGCSQTNLEITECTSDMELSATYGGDVSTEFDACVGGFVGLAFGVNVKNDGDLEHDGEIIINKCRNNGNISYKQTQRINSSGLGGFIGIVKDLSTDNDVTCKMYNCINNATLNLISVHCFWNLYIGGLVAYNYSNGSSSSKPCVQNCVNNGDFTYSDCNSRQGHCYFGGIVGYNYDNDTKISYCANSGTVGAGDYAISSYCGTLNECWRDSNKSYAGLHYNGSATNSGSNTINEIVDHMNATSFVDGTNYYRWKLTDGKLDLDF